MKRFLLEAVLLMAMAAICNATAFTNGSFESPGGSSIVFLSAGSGQITGWTLGNGNGNLFYAQNGDWGINAQAGTWYIGWGGNGATGGTLFQTFDTVAGTTYNVNYFLTTQQLTGVLPIESDLVEALNGATVLNSVTNSFNQAAGVWNAGSILSFTATSSSTTLRFTDTTTAANSIPINWGLDNVSVVAAGGSATPEPATFAIVGLGFGILAVWRRRRASTEHYFCSDSDWSGRSPAIPQRRGHLRCGLQDHAAARSRPDLSDSGS